MHEPCTIFRTIQKIRGATHCNMAFIGGSLTVATGASNNAITTWRRLFVQYIFERYHRRYHCQPGEIVSAIGAMESFAASFFIPRNVARFNPDICFLEFCVNDRDLPDNKILAKKGTEGIIRQLLQLKNTPDIVLLGAGCKPGTDNETGDIVDHSLHREIAEHYGLPFLDIQSYIFKTLQQRGQTWDDIAVLFLEEDDPVHLNDYGNRLWFEAMKDWFEDQERLFDENPLQRTQRTHIEPLHSDELQYVSLVDVSKRNKNIERQGSWVKKEAALVPWYFDALMIGRPGDTMTFRFTGTAVGLVALVHQNGLKIEVTLDGKEIPGAFTRFHFQFGKFYMFAHGMENVQHEVHLRVAGPSAKLHKLEDPTAEVGYFAVAHPPQDQDKG